MNDQLTEYSEWIELGNHLTKDQVSEVSHLLVDNLASVENKIKFLKKMAFKGETDEEFSSFVSAFRALATNPNLEEFAPRAIDLCGTGGDRTGSFNLSTFVSMLVAAAGIPVIKHGNRSISSKCGSADLLEALGIPLETDPDKLKSSLSHLNFCFLYAPHFHPAFKHLAEARKMLAKEGIITLFNRLGPCLNPAQPSYQILGVYNADYLTQLAYTLEVNGGKSGWVVHGKLDEKSEQGMDELTACGSNLICGYGLASEGAKISSMHPSYWSQKTYPPSHLKGGSLEQNLNILKSILAGSAPDGLLSSILINASSALKISGKADSIEEGIDLARQVLFGGKLSIWLKRAQEYYAK